MTSTTATRDSAPPPADGRADTDPVARAGALAVGATLGFLMLAFIVDASPAQSYPELISSGLSASDGRKSGDLLAWPLAVLVGVTAGLLAAAIIRSRPTPIERRSLAIHLLWWSIPALVAAASLVTTPGLRFSEVFLSVGAHVFILVMASVSQRRGDGVPATFITTSALGIVAWSLVPIGLGTAWGRIFHPGGTGLSQLWAYLALAVGALALASQVVACLLRPSFFERQVVFFTGSSQFLIPGLLFAFLPAQLALPDGTTRSFPVSELLPWVVAVTTMVAMAGIARRVWRVWRQPVPSAGRSLDRASGIISPIAVGVVLLAAMFGRTQPPILSGDDYHFGEQLVGWASYAAGRLPFLGYSPPHGLAQDDMGATFAALFYDGTAASHGEGYRLFCAILAATLFAVLWWTSHDLLLSGLVLVVATGSAVNVQWALLVTAGWLWLAPRLRAQPRWWLPMWLLTVPLVLAAAPAQGLVLVAASLLLVLPSVASVMSARTLRDLAPTVVTAIVAGTALLFTPLAMMLRSAVSYVLRNASINSIAYGVPWHPATMEGLPSTPWIYDVLRMVWVVGPVLCVVVACGQLLQGRFFSERLLASLFMSTFMLGVLTYVMGRLDGGVSSRPGIATGFVLALVVPALVWRQLSPARRPLLAFAMVGVVAALSGAPASVGTVLDAAHSRVASPALVDGSAQGLPGWGVAAPADPLQLQQVTALGELLDERLQKGQPYFDATSHNAQYFYLGRAPVTAVTAAYNIPSIAEQLSTIKQLRRQRPEIAVLLQPQGNNVHDGGGLALRTPLLARYLEKAYVPYEENGFILGARRHAAGSPTLSVVSLPLATVSDATWDRGVNRQNGDLLLADGRAAALFRPGTQLTLSDGSRRIVVSANGQEGVIELDRPPARTFVDGDALSVTSPLTALRAQLYYAWLFDRSFGNSDLGSSPTAWGRSLDDATGIERIGRLRGRGSLTTSAPSMDVGLPPQSRSGHNADLVSFEVTCSSGSGTPRLRLSWSGGVLHRAFDTGGRTFDVRGSTQLVPLDSSSFWHMANWVTRLHLTLVDGGGCSRVSILPKALYKRTGE